MGCFSRTLRQPGESYIDYSALLDSVRLRRERLLEEELWRSFCEFAGASPDGLSIDPSVVDNGLLPVDQLTEFFLVPHVRQALTRSGVADLTDLTDLSKDLESAARQAVCDTAPISINTDGTCDKGLVSECLNGAEKTVEAP